MKKKQLLSGLLFCSILWISVLFIGCNVTSNNNESSSEESLVSTEETSLDVGFLEKINGEVMSIEEAQKQIEDENFTIEIDYHLLTYAYKNLQEQIGYEQIKEVIRIYFKCFFEPTYWANYEFVGDALIDRWEIMYQSITNYILYANENGMSYSELEEISEIRIIDVYYNDEENWYIRVACGSFTYGIHLKKINEQWCVVKVVTDVSIVGGEEQFLTEEDEILQMEMWKEIIQKAREKNPITEDVIQKGIEVAISYESFYHYLSEEEVELLKSEMEVIYDKEWCDSLLCLSMPEYDYNMNQLKFIVWIQMKEDYDVALEGLKEKAFGKGENGTYRVVSYSQEDGWSVDEMIFVVFPNYNDKNVTKKLD